MFGVWKDFFSLKGIACTSNMSVLLRVFVQRYSYVRGRTVILNTQRVNPSFRWIFFFMCRRVARLRFFENCLRPKLAKSSPMVFSFYMSFSMIDLKPFFVGISYLPNSKITLQKNVYAFGTRPIDTKFCLKQFFPSCEKCFFIFCFCGSEMSSLSNFVPIICKFDLNFYVGGPSRLCFVFIEFFFFSRD